MQAPLPEIHTLVAALLVQGTARCENYKTDRLPRRITAARADASDLPSFDCGGARWGRGLDAGRVAARAALAIMQSACWLGVAQALLGVVCV
jgi:hypothetical protein